MSLCPTGFPGLCACCPIKPPTTGLPSSASVTPSATAATTTATQATPTGCQQQDVAADLRSSSVAVLRRKAQEHSAALLSLHAAAAAGFPFPGFPLPHHSMHPFFASQNNSSEPQNLSQHDGTERDEDQKRDVAKHEKIEVEV